MTDERSHPYAAKTDEGRAAQLANLTGSRPPSHGLRSRVVMAPLREQAEEWARVRWPNLDDTRRHLVASLAARVERVRIWSDSNDILIGGSRRPARTHPVVDSCDRWEARLDQMIRTLDVEQAERDKPLSILEQQLRGLPRPPGGEE